MTDRTQHRARRVGAFALALAITLSAMGAAAAVISARTPDASDIPLISTARPLVTPLSSPSTAEESTATPTPAVEATLSPTPADRYVPGVAAGNDDDEREVITPPVREDDDSEDDSSRDGSETDVKRESLPETDGSPEEH